MIDLDGRVAVVTSGSSGMGLATDGAAAGSGRIGGTVRPGRNPPARAETGLRARFPGKLYAARCDVLDHGRCAPSPPPPRLRWDPQMLVNNAGQGRVSTFADTEDEAGPKNCGSSSSP